MPLRCIVVAFASFAVRLRFFFDAADATLICDAMILPPLIHAACAAMSDGFSLICAFLCADMMLSFASRALFIFMLP